MQEEICEILINLKNVPEVIKKRFLVLVLAKLINHSVRRLLGEIINTCTVQSTFNQINVTLYLIRKN